MEHMKRGARAAEPGYWPKGARHVASRPFFACGAPLMLPYSPNSAFSGVMGRVRT